MNTPETTVTVPDPDTPLTKEQLEKLTSMSMLGRNITFKYKHKPGRYTVGLVEDEVYIIVGDYKHLIQRVKFEDDVSWDGSTHAYRTGYYTYEASRKNIKWGQYHPVSYGERISKFTPEGQRQGLGADLTTKNFDLARRSLILPQSSGRGRTIETKLLSTSFVNSSANFANVSGDAGIVVFVPRTLVTTISARLQYAITNPYRDPIISGASEVVA